MQEFLQTLLNGLPSGGMYALVALGYTMVYGVAKLLNFAHGDFVMIGGFIVYLLTGWLLPLWLAIIISILATILLACLTEKLAYKPLRKSKRITILTTAIGVSLLLENLISVLTAGKGKTLPQLMEYKAIELGGGIVLSNIALLEIIISAVIMVALLFFVNFTKYGKAMRAVSENPDASKLMGISVNNITSMAFAIGASFCTIVALMWSSFSPITYNMGSSLGIKAFIAAVIGGVGSIPGAMIGGILIGLIESLTKTYISTSLADAIVYCVLIVVLIVKPTGLFGKNIEEKV